MSKFSEPPIAVAGELPEERLVRSAEELQRERTAARLSRRSLITNLGMAAGAAGVLGITGCSDAGPVTLTPPTTTPSVLDILNFALNLEYLEATFYSVVVTGSGLSSADMGSSAGAASGGAKVAFANSAVGNIAANLMTEEVQHVEFLRATIASVGGTPVSMPALNLAPSTIPAVTNDATFLAVARQLEGVGVSAYIGGAQYLASNTAALTYAAQVLDVEAQHEGALRQACIQFGVASPAADGLDMPPSMTKEFNTNSTTGLNPVRTISQVLSIVYGASTSTSLIPATGISSGGFFPNGLNGNIYTT